MYGCVCCCQFSVDINLHVGFLMILKSRKLMRPLGSCVGLNCSLQCSELECFCQFVLVGVNSNIIDEDIVYVTCVVEYLLELYEGFDVGVFCRILQTILQQTTS